MSIIQADASLAAAAIRLERIIAGMSKPQMLREVARARASILRAMSHVAAVHPEVNILHTEGRAA